MLDWDNVRTNNEMALTPVGELMSELMKHNNFLFGEKQYSRTSRSLISQTSAVTSSKSARNLYDTGTPSAIFTTIG